MHPRSLVAALGCVLGLVGSAPAVATSGAPERTFPFHAGAMVVDWPFAGGSVTLEPRAIVRVALHAPARMPRSARLRLLLAPGGGRRVHVVAQRRLRTGGFRARLGAKAGLRYVLAFDFGHVHRRTVIRAARSAPCAGAEPPGSVAAATLRLDPTVATPGAAVTVTLRNTGSACLVSGYDHRWEQLVAGTWEPVADPAPFPTVALLTAPRASTKTTAVVPATAAPGRYRLVKTVARRSLPGQAALTLSAELEVAAP